MKKLFVISIASLALIFSSCKKSTTDAAQTADTTTTVATEAAAVTESAAFTAAQAKLTDIQKMIDEAKTIDELKPAAEAVESFKAEIEKVASTLSAEEKATISELFQNVVESAQKKEAELKKK